MQRYMQALQGIKNMDRLKKVTKNTNEGGVEAKNLSAAHNAGILVLQ